jgi:tryptophan synthase beta subunit
MTKPKTGAQRQAALRDKGRQIAVLLRDPAAIAALDKLAEKHGGVTAAVSHALVHAARSSSAKVKPRAPT